MNTTLELWQIWRCNENGREYQVISMDAQEICATTQIPHTPGIGDAFNWLSGYEEFLAAFTFVKSGPKPAHS